MPQTEERKEAYGKKCEHGKKKSRCVDCGGSGICQHKIIKSNCKECGGRTFCQHKKQKRNCKECGGSAFCVHGKYKQYCRECGGSAFCQHNRQKKDCKDCRGSNYCIHEIRRADCKKCMGRNICCHNKYKGQCKDCDFTSYMVHLQRTQLKRILHLTDLEKTKPSIQYLGCEAIYFKEYIEKKMTEGMTWDNIHLDHIKPVSVFNLESIDELLDCCHYSNFQPLLAEVNLAKSD